MPRHPKYESNAKRQKAYRLRQANAAADLLAQHLALRTMAGVDEDTVIDDMLVSLMRSNVVASEESDTSAAFAVGHQQGYEEGYQAGYADAASMRLQDLLKARQQDGTNSPI